MFHTVLLALDLNDTGAAARAAEAAIAMARDMGSALHVVNVLPDSGMAIVGAAMQPDHLAKLSAQAQGALETWIAATVPAGVSATPHVAVGTVYDQILRTANQIDADAIVVGAHRPELKDYLIGPNAARVARHARQSVFVIREA